MKKILMLLILVAGLTFGQTYEWKSYSFLDSAATTDSFQIPKGMWPSAIKFDDLGPKIAEFDFDIKFWDSNTWYPVAIADSNFAIRPDTTGTGGSVLTLPDWFNRFKAPYWTNEPIYMRLDPNDSDTTTRTFHVQFQGE